MSNNKGLLSKFVSIFTKVDEVAAAEERLQQVNTARIEEARLRKGNKSQVNADDIDLSILNDEAALLYGEVVGQVFETNALTKEVVEVKERNRMMRKLLQKAEETELALLAAQEAFTNNVFEEEELNLQVALKRQKAASILDTEVSKALPSARAALRAKARKAAEEKMQARLANPPVTPTSEQQVEPPKKGRKKPPTTSATTAEEALKALAAALAAANLPTTNAQGLVGATEVAHLGLDKADLRILACAKTLFSRLKWQPSLWEGLDPAAEGERRKAAKSPAGTVSGIDLTAEGDDGAPVATATNTPLGGAKEPEKTAPGTL